jgi:hypothetical protein
VTQQTSSYELGRTVAQLGYVILEPGVPTHYEWKRAGLAGPSRTPRISASKSQAVSKMSSSRVLRPTGDRQPLTGANVGDILEDVAEGDDMIRRQAKAVKP